MAGLKKDQFSGVNSGVLIPMDDTQNSAALAGLKAGAQGISNIASLVNQQEDKRENLEKSNSSIEYYNASNEAQKDIMKLMGNAEKTGDYSGLPESSKKVYEEKMSFIQNTEFEKNRSYLQQQSHKDFDSLMSSINTFSVAGEQKILLQDFGKASQDTASLIYTSPNTAKVQTNRMIGIIENLDLPRVKKDELINKIKNTFTYDELRGKIDLKSVNERNTVNNDLLNGKYNNKLKSSQIRDLLSLSEKKGSTSKSVVKSAFNNAETAYKNGLHIRSEDVAALKEGFGSLNSAKQEQSLLMMKSAELNSPDANINDVIFKTNQLPSDTQGKSDFKKAQQASNNLKLSEVKNDASGFILNKVAQGKDKKALNDSYNQIMSGDIKQITTGLQTMKAVTDGYGGYLESKGYPDISDDYLAKNIASQIGETIKSNNPTIQGQMRAYKEIGEISKAVGGEDFSNNIVRSIAGNNIAVSLMYAPRQVTQDIIQANTAYKGEDLKNKDIQEWRTTNEAIDFFNSDSTSQSESDRNYIDSTTRSMSLLMKFRKDNGIDDGLTPSEAFKEITQNNDGDEVTFGGFFSEVKRKLFAQAEIIKDLDTKSGGKLLKNEIKLSQKDKEIINIAAEKKALVYRSIEGAFDDTQISKTTTEQQMFNFITNMPSNVVVNTGFTKEYIPKDRLLNDGLPYIVSSIGGRKIAADMDDISFRPVNGSKTTFVAMYPSGGRMEKALTGMRVPNKAFDKTKPESDTNKRERIVYKPYMVKARWEIK
ncbi:MAG: hypothetical protein ACTSP4_00655 [Candidatus Hodarchaeales archaeon]